MASVIDLRYVETPRLRHAYRVHGDDSGMPVLLLHSGFATSRWWLPLIELLPDEFFVIAPDLRGCGASDKPDDGYTIVAMAEDVAALVEAMALRDFDLVGHGVGGAVAAEYLMRGAGDVRTLTLVNSAPIEGVYTPPESMQLLARMRYDTGLLRAALVALMPVFAATQPVLFERLVEDAAAMAPAAFTDLTASLNEWNRFADARALTQPTLLLWGADDTMVTREEMTRTLLAIPGAANLDILNGVGHCPMLDAPLLVAERLVDFLTEDFAASADVRARGLSA